MDCGGQYQMTTGETETAMWSADNWDSSETVRMQHNLHA